MNIQEVIERMEREWDVDGFLGNVRTGIFSISDADQFLAFLRSIEIEEDALVPKRIVSLFWMLPSFLEWQKQRVREAGGRGEDYDRFATEVQNTLEKVLGVP